MFKDKGLIDPNQTLKPKPMLGKTEIPLEHFTLEYIQNCKDVKELEKIIGMLRSNGERHCSELQKKAEECLHLLSPTNRQHRSNEPVLTRTSLKNGDWINFESDFCAWRREIDEREQQMLTEENNNNAMEQLFVPAIRHPHLASASENKAAGNVIKTKQDVAELYKMDMEQEKQEQEQKKQFKEREIEEQREKENEKQKREKRQVETNRLNALLNDAEKLPNIEKQRLAEQEMEIGNEYYKEKEYNEAIEYYTASINIWPTSKAYNKRSACYLKQCKYKDALQDATSTLALDPNNVKALFRRGIAFQHKNKFKEALADMNSVLNEQPKHVLAQHISKELREQLLTLPRTVRILGDEGCNKQNKVVERSLDAISKHYPEVNEWGLPNVMCLCSGSPRFLQFAPRKSHTHFQPQPTATLVSNARIVEVIDNQEVPKLSNKPKIVEVEQSESSEDFFRQKMCVVVRDRTLLKPFYNGNKNMNMKDDGSSKISESAKCEIVNTCIADSSQYATTEDSDEADV